MPASAGQVVVSIAADSSAYTAEMSRVEAIAKKTGVSVRDSLSKVTGLPSTVTQSVAALKKESSEAKASLALMGEEFGVKLPRHVRSFVAELPGVSKAMSAAFGAFAVVGIADALGEAAKKVYELYEAFKNVEEAPKRITQGFLELNAPLQQSNDELSLTNDKLKNAIAKLTGRPQNGLATALDEARVSADKLGLSLDKDLKETAALLKENSVGAVAAFFTGRQSTGDIEDKAKEFQEKISDINAEGNAKIHAATTDADATAARAELNIKLEKAYGEQIAWTNQQIDQRKNHNTTTQTVGNGMGYSQTMEVEGPNQEAAIAMLRGLRSNYQMGDDSISLSSQNDQLNKQYESAQANKGNGEQADKMLSAQNTLTQAQRTAASEGITVQLDIAKAGSQAQLAVLESQHKLQLVSDADYYAKKSALQKGELSAERSALEQQSALITAQIAKESGQKFSTGPQEVEQQAKLVELKAKQSELAGQIAELTGKEASQASQLTTELKEAARANKQRLDDTRAELERMNGSGSADQVAASRNRYTTERAGLVAGGASADDLAKADALQTLKENEIRLQAQETQLQQIQNGYKLAELQIAAQLDSHDITKVEAAQQLALLHTQELAEVSALAPAYQAAAEAAGKAGTDGLIKMQEVYTEVAKAGKQDPLANGGIRAGIAAWANDTVNNAQSTAASVKQVFTNAINDVNTQLTNLLSGKKADFGKMFQSMSADIGGQVLKSVEAKGLSALGFGGGAKRDGSSAANALFVQFGGVAGATSGGAGILSGFTSGTKSGSIQGGSTDDTSGLGGAIGQLPKKGMSGLWSALKSAIGIGAGAAGAASGDVGSGDDMDIFNGLGSGGGISGDSIPGFADGGITDPGKAFVAGEHGPEIVAGTQASRVFNAADTAGMFGGNPGHTTNINIHSGANPVETQAAVRRGMQAAYQASTRDGVKASTEHQRRVPRMAAR